MVIGYSTTVKGYWIGYLPICSLNIASSQGYWLYSLGHASATSNHFEQRVGQCGMHCFLDRHFSLSLSCLRALLIFNGTKGSFGVVVRALLMLQRHPMTGAPQRHVVAIFVLLGGYSLNLVLASTTPKQCIAKGGK